MRGDAFHHRRESDNPSLPHKQEKEPFAYQMHQVLEVDAEILSDASFAWQRN